MSDSVNVSFTNDDVTKKPSPTAVLLSANLFSFMKPQKQPSRGVLKGTLIQI